MTERLYWAEMSRREMETVVQKVNRKEIVLDKTVFYPTGGGQPCDNGMLEINGTGYKIIDVKSAGDDVVHVSDTDFNAKPGDIVKGTIDWKRRYAHMRYHTAMHVIDGVIGTKYGQMGLATGGQLYADHARVDYDMPELDSKLAEKVIEQANLILAEGHDVVARDISRDEALKIESLSRTEPGRELIKKLERIRIIDIVGFDAQADGGTHVSNTREVGKIRFVKMQNNGKHNKRIEFILE